jgi:hypothetical protein
MLTAKVHPEGGARKLFGQISSGTARDVESRTKNWRKTQNEVGDWENAQRKDATGKLMVNMKSDLDALFAVPLSEFTAARNALARRLAADRLSDEAARVKGMSKPSVSAWAVNQLYWKHREEFDRLLSAGKRLAQAQTLLLAGKVADVRGAQAARNEATSILLQFASELLREAGHNPSLETMRRITTTLEALSVYPSVSNAPIPGRLTDDVAPLGFELLAALAPGANSDTPTNMRSRPLRNEPNGVPQAGSHGVRKQKQNRRTELASAEAGLQTAEQVLREAQANVKNVAAALEKATALVDETDQDRRHAEERLAKTRAAVNAARQRIHDLDVEAGKAKRMLRHAERSAERARSRLKQLRAAGV